MEEICRCCACEGPSKDIISKYNWMGDEEVYSDMLKECFSVDLVHQMDYSGICEVCITQLRMAFNFKKQVLNTEEQFKRKLEELGEHKNRIKVEVQEAPSETDDNDNDHDDIPDSPDDDSDDDEFLANIKTEPEEKPKVAKKRQAKAKAPAKAKKMKVEGETSQSLGVIGVKTEPVSGQSTAIVPRIIIIHPPKKPVTKKKRTPKVTEPRNKQTYSTFIPIKVAAPKPISQIKPLAKTSSRPKMKNDNSIVVKNLPKLGGLTLTTAIKVKALSEMGLKVTTANELEKHKRNLTAVLSYSNATIVTQLPDHSYSCEYCSTKFPKPYELKAHILDAHANNKLDYLKRHFTLEYFLVQLDTTDLTCNLCSQKCKLLEDLLEHLSSEHEKVLDTVKEKRMLQFNMPNDQLLCAYCSKAFRFFKPLYMHLNSHYRNYECDDCGAGYVLKRKLTIHKTRHKKGSFKCDSCDMVFDLAYKREDHKRKVHKGPPKLFKCQYCPLRFLKTGERKQHSIDVHGKEILPDFKCDACEQCFYSSGSLSMHKRKYHLMERSHGCTQCSKSFFSKRGLENHMVTHTGERPFQCEVCSKSYGLKKTLVEHMRIHLNDRRHKCELCDQAFVQKCSLKGHMRSKHGKED